MSRPIPRRAEIRKLRACAQKVARALRRGTVAADLVHLGGVEPSSIIDTLELLDRFAEAAGRAAGDLPIAGPFKTRAEAEVAATRFPFNRL